MIIFLPFPLKKTRTDLRIY